MEKLAKVKESDSVEATIYVSFERQLSFKRLFKRYIKQLVRDLWSHSVFMEIEKLKLLMRISMIFHICYCPFNSVATTAEWEVNGRGLTDHAFFDSF